jgi:hypothetical protein
LVAIIGNKGKGKSALTDTIGLLSNTKQSGDFTFLSSKNFRQPKDNKAKQFQATLEWESGRTITKGLDDDVDESQPEHVKYIPQNFLEKICTQLGGIEETQFDRELKKVIFSHVDAATRLGKSSLDELISYKTSEGNSKIQILKQELHRINEEIVSLEERSRPENRQKINNLLFQKQLELSTHESSKPVEVEKPENDPQTQAEMLAVAEAIDQAKKRLDEYEHELVLAAEEEVKQAQLVSIADRLSARIENLERQIDSFKLESEFDFSQIGLSVNDVLTISIDRKPLEDKRTEYDRNRRSAENRKDPQILDSPAYKKANTETEIAKLQLQLDETNKRYQAYVTALNTWAKRRQAIIGNETEVGTIKYYEKQITELDSLPSEIAQVTARRWTKPRSFTRLFAKWSRPTVIFTLLSTTL